MNDFGRASERWLCAAIAAAFAALWLLVVVAAGPHNAAAAYLRSAFQFALLAAAWMIAMRLVWRAFWCGARARFERADGAACVMAISVALLSDRRREWGDAMSAELEHIDGRTERWQFAIGCLRAAAFAPPERSSRAVLAALLTIAIVLATRIGFERTMPATRVFATTFVTVVGVAAVIGSARSRGGRGMSSTSSVTDERGSDAPIAPRLSSTDCTHRGRQNHLARHLLFAVTITSALLACATFTWWFRAKQVVPSFPSHAPLPAVSLTLAFVLASCTWVALAPPRCIAVHPRASAIGAGGAVVLIAALLATTFQTNISADTISMPGVPMAFALTSWITVRTERSFRAGVEAAIWFAIAGVAFTCAVWLISGRSPLSDWTVRSLQDGLGELLRIVIAIPLLGLPFGVTGAACAGRERDEPASISPSSMR